MEGFWKIYEKFGLTDREAFDLKPQSKLILLLLLLLSTAAFQSLMLKLAAFGSAWRYARNRRVGPFSRYLFDMPCNTIDSTGFAIEMSDSAMPHIEEEEEEADHRSYIDALRARRVAWLLNEWRQLFSSQLVKKTNVNNVLINYKTTTDVKLYVLESLKSFDGDSGNSTYMGLLGSFIGDDDLRDESYLERLLVVFQRLIAQVTAFQSSSYLSYYLDIQDLVLDLKLNPDFVLQLLRAQVLTDHESFSAEELADIWFEMRRRMEDQRWSEMFTNMTGRKVVLLFRGWDIFLHPAYYAAPTNRQIKNRAWLLNEYQLYNSLAIREVKKFKRLFGVVSKKLKNIERNRVGTSHTSILIKLGCLSGSDRVDEMRERSLVAVQGVLFSDLQSSTSSSNSVCRLWPGAAVVHVVALERAIFASCEPGHKWSYHFKMKNLIVNLKLNHAFTLRILGEVAENNKSASRVEESGELWESLRKDSVAIMGFNDDPKSFISKEVDKTEFSICGKNDLLLHPAMFRTPASGEDFVAAMEIQRKGEWSHSTYSHPRRVYHRLGYYKMNKKK